MAKKGGLGKGVDALFFDNSVEEGVVTLPLSEIEPNRAQPRKAFDEAALSELSASIAEHGVLQPLLVRPRAEGGYRLVAGERRYRAARMAGLSVVPVTVREMTDEEESIFALIENLQREDLNPLEEAEGLQQLITRFGLTQEQAASRVGKSRTAVTNALRLLQLPEKTAALVREGKLSMGPREHVVRPGETLAMIAQRYEVSMAALRSSNSLSSDNLKVGQALSIPSTALAAQ